MRKAHVVAGLAAITASAVVGGAFAQAVPEVTVTTSKIVEKSAGRTSTGIPIVDVSLSYGVSAAGLDLASASGAREFEKRVSDAATEACKDLGKRYPNATPTDAACAKAATDKAMVRVREMESAAAKK
ncbi:MAG TPA: UrcA family protein [Steroidobacteraceae bacterium]|nr:UrcA family protein [Steroidobacteraceae bacterium]